MKNIIRSASLAALGAATLNAAYAPGASSMEASKPWSVSATLRGFYDDNYATAPSFRKRDSFGFEVSPSAGLNLFRDQTTLGLSYTYDMKYYWDRQPHRADHSHQASAKISHAFNPRIKLDVSDSFVIAQEPTILDPTAVVTTPLRTEGNNMRNTGNITGSFGLTQQLDLVLGYNNNWYNYEQKGISSLSTLLDRYEHLFMANLRWTIVPSTIGVVGYQYGQIDYTSPGLVGLTPGGVGILSSVRDNHSNYGYVGVDHTFNPKLNGSVRLGIQDTEYPNAPGGSRDTLNPYVDANATYTYMQGSFLQLGVRHARNATDVGYINAFGSVSPTTDVESTTVYGSLNHQIFPRLMASLIGQYQNSEFQGGAANKLSDNLFLAGININYQINKFLAAEAGYNYDRLSSGLERLGVSRSFTRNRVYIGVRATY